MYRDGALAAGQSHDVLPAAQHLADPAHGRAAAAAAWQQAAEVAGTVADQRHALPAQRREHHFAGLAGRQPASRLRVDDLEQQVGLADVHAVVGTALHTAGEAGLREAVVLEHLAAPAAGDRSSQRVRNVIGGQQHRLDWRGTARCQPVDEHRRTDERLGVFLSDKFEHLFRACEGTAGQTSAAHPLHAPGQQVADAARAAGAEQHQREAVARRDVCHAHGKIVHRAFLVLVREKYSLAGPGGAGGADRNDAAHVARTGGQQVGAVLADFGRRRERQLREVCRRAQRVEVEPGQFAAIELAVGGRVGQRVLKLSKLPAAQGVRLHGAAYACVPAYEVIYRRKAHFAAPLAAVSRQ